MSIIRVASRYAKSLIEIAQEKGKLERIREDVISFAEVAKIRDFNLLLKSPVVKPDKKIAIMEKIFEGKYDAITMEFLKILVRKNREMYLPEIAAEFLELYRHIKNITIATVISAKPLSPETLEAIRQKLLESQDTYSSIEIKTELDPNLIGGYIIEFDDKRYDTSVKHKLEQLKKEFKHNLYISQIIA
jgi:F-type H+-transporting ATPase subunit delta